MNPKFPHINVKLVGEDGNAFAIMGRVTRAMRKGGCTDADIDAFRKQATSGDYDNLLRTVMETVTTDEDEDDYPNDLLDELDEEMERTVSGED